MSTTPDGVEQLGLTIASRRVLPRALVALADQRDSVILVGAQAAHLRSQEVDLRVATFTSDGDLGVDPARLKDVPRLERVLREAGFIAPGDDNDHQPGTWHFPEIVDGLATSIAVDLLVPESFAEPGGRRGARIGRHDRRAARKVAGLEPVVVDHDILRVASLEPHLDPTTVEVKVAGIAALLIAKAFKIADRLADPKPGRLSHKDASDVIRLMRASDTDQVAASCHRLLADARVGEVTRAGLDKLRQQFGAGRTPGTNMAVTALQGAVDERLIRILAPAYLALLP